MSLLLIAVCFACGERQKSSTPLETLKAYGSAFKKKDLTAMKLLLSDASLKMAEQEAKAQNVTVDDIVRREKLFSEDQTTAEFRNQKIEGDKATVEIKDPMGIWNTVHFVRENGAWKIDKQAFADQMQLEFEQKKKELDDMINQGKQP